MFSSSQGFPFPLSGQGCSTLITRQSSPGSQKRSINSSEQPENLNPVRLIRTPPVLAPLKMLIRELHPGQRIYDLPRGIRSSGS